MARGQILASSINLHRRYYNTVALPCECVMRFLWPAVWCVLRFLIVVGVHMSSVLLHQKCRHSSRGVVVRRVTEVAATSETEGVSRRSGCMYHELLKFTYSAN